MKLIACLLAATLIAVSPVASQDKTKAPKTKAPKTKAPKTKAPKTEQAVAPIAKVQSAFDVMLAAIAAKDYAAFLAPTDANFKEALSREDFDAVSAQLAPRLKAGHQATFLGELKQQGFRVFLWKVSFEDGDDDYLARLTMKADKISGFFQT